MLTRILSLFRRAPKPVVIRIGNLNRLDGWWPQTPAGAPGAKASDAPTPRSWRDQGLCWDCGNRPLLGEFRCIRCHLHD